MDWRKPVIRHWATLTGLWSCCKASSTQLPQTPGFVAACTS